ncbi:transposase [Bacillus cereus]|nr:transposase [Bacillus cereus]
MILLQSFTRQILFKTWKSFFQIHHCKKIKQELSEYKAIYMIKDYFLLLFQTIQNILRLVVQTKALVRTTIFFIVEVKRRSWVFLDPESVYKTDLLHLPYLNQFLVYWSSRSYIRNANR